MASLTGNTIQSTYDALLKVTDNGSITGSLKRITDGLGNNTPLYLSNSAAEFTSALNVTGAITGSNLSGTNTGDETNASIKSKLGAATGSNDGYLTSADWTTFMAKIAGSGTLNKLAKFSSSSSIADSTITDTGSAVTIGVATSVTGSLTASSIIKSGGTSSQFLKADGSIDSNSYALASSLSSYVPTSRTLTINGTAYDLSANRSWSVGTVTSIATSAPLTGGTITSSGTIGITQATTSTNGYLSSTDWNTFNNKQNALTNPVTGTGTSGYHAKFTGGSTIGSSVIFDDGTNVGLGTVNPAVKLHVENTGTGTTTFSNVISTFRSQAAGRDISLQFSDGSNQAYIGSLSGSLYFGTGGATERMRITLGGDILFNGGDTSSQVSTATPKTFRFNNDYSNGATDSSLKLYLFNSGSTRQGFTSGPAYDLQYHSSGDANGKHIWYVNNTERMRIVGGNVGIGTTSPQAPLQVVGTGVGGYGLISARGENAHLGFRTAADAFKGWVGYFNSATHGSDVDLNIKTGYNGASNIRFSINGDSGEAMRITSGGNVGIATTSPNAKFEVAGVSSNTDFRISRTVAPSVYFSVSAPGGSPNSSNLGINGTDVMTLNASGNVGIGTTSPSTKLHIGGVGSAISFDTTGAAATSIIKTVEDYKLSLSSNRGTSTEIKIGDSNLEFLTATAERMRITSGGNVGIGTTSPLVPLQVSSGAGTFPMQVTNGNFVNSSTGTRILFGFGAASGNTYGDIRASSDGGLTAANLILQQSGGNVLIGTTSDIFNNAKLQVNGGMTYQNLFNRRTASYTLSISDQNYIVEMNVGSANNLTVPPNSSVAFPVGTEIAVLQYGAGQTTIVAGSGVTLKSKSNALKISGQYAGCTLVKVGTDEWYVVGDLTL